MTTHLCQNRELQVEFTEWTTHAPQETLVRTLAKKCTQMYTKPLAIAITNIIQPLEGRQGKARNYWMSLI